VRYEAQVYPNTPGQYLPQNDRLREDPVSHLGIQRSSDATGVMIRRFRLLGVPELSR